MTISNEEFLKTLFEKEFGKAHVTDFTYDPYDIPEDKHLIAWKGDYFQNYHFNRNKSNQYFTISLFNPDEQNIARRRKDLFIKTCLIVLDDVKEKLSLDAAKLLPKPTYIIETSLGSEQWGYVLTKPCEDRHKVENLLDGLVANGLAPNGKDPGMKGVTRYIRLPEGHNTKKVKLVDGQPFKCRLVEWNPFLTSTLEQLAEPFNVDLNTPRWEGGSKELKDIPDHPVFQSGLNIKSHRGTGRWDITCPWVENHTKAVDNGSAFFIKEDGSIKFKCHHGNCEDKTSKDLLNYLEEKYTGFKDEYKKWQILNTFKDLVEEPLNPVPLPPGVNKPQKDFQKPSSIDDVIVRLKKEYPGTKQCRTLVSEFLRLIEDLPQIDKHYYHQEICDLMQWSKVDFTKILKDLRSKWYEKETKDFYSSIVFIKEQNRFYDHTSKIFFTPEAFQNSFAHEDNEAKKEALMNGRVEKVDKMDFAPKMPRIFKRDDVVYTNTWNAKKELQGTKGDCSQWLDHWKMLGWEANQKHMLQWMAYTILHPENKINHMLLLGGMEGTGKDFLLYPLLKAMGDYGNVIDGHEMLSGFNEYLLGTKYIHINETELGDHHQAIEISNKLKPLAAAPPDTLRVNQKGITPIKIQNIVNLTMTTNSQMPVKLTGPSRRFYATWSDLNVRNQNDDMVPEWLTYWTNRWGWMKNGGVGHCTWYLRNCVNLSNFNPGAAPVMTEFLRNIRESSKSPGQQTIEAFIESKLGYFRKDLITANEASATLRAGILGYEEFMYIESTWFTPTKVGRVMRDIPSCVRLRAKKDKDIRLWAVRGKQKYESMTMLELAEAYYKQGGDETGTTILK